MNMSLSAVWSFLSFKKLFIHSLCSLTSCISILFISLFLHIHPLPVILHHNSSIWTLANIPSMVSIQVAIIPLWPLELSLQSPLCSQLLLGSPIKAYLQHSAAFLIQSPNVFHIPLNYWFSGFLMNFPCYFFCIWLKISPTPPSFSPAFSLTWKSSPAVSQSAFY